MERRRTIIIGAGLLGALALVAAWPIARAWHRIFPSPLREGRSAYERRDWSRAAFLAMGVLNGKPDDPGTLRLLARSSGRLGRDESAGAIYKRLGYETLGPEDFLIIAAGLHAQGRPRPGLHVACHMPPVRSAVPHTTFTDHHIRVHR